MKLSAKIAVSAIAVGVIGTALDEFSDQFLARHRHEQRIDEILADATAHAWLNEQSASGGDEVSPELGELLGSAVFQVVTPQGQVLRFGPVALPVDDRVLALAAGEGAGQGPTTISIDGESYRYVATHRPGLGVAQAAVSLEMVDALIGASGVHLTLMALLILGFGVISAIAAARWLIGPLGRLATASRLVAETGRFDVDLEEGRNDEVGVVARSFRRMLEALSVAQSSQQRIIEDVGHELRTPITSLRTNIELLARHPTMPEETRSDILRSLSAEVREMSSLIDRLRDSWMIAADAERPTSLRLDRVVEEVVAQFRRRTDRAIELTVRPVTVHVRPNVVKGAVANLIDNALKYDTSGGVVEVAVGPDGVWVRDHGPGISDEDRQRVFGRFYRGAAAEHLPGSGIGLSMVADAALQLGGEARASTHPDGGAVVGFSFTPAAVLGSRSGR